MNRREHSHRIVCTMQVTFSRNVIRQSLVRTNTPGGMRVQQTLPPTFLFLQYSVFKDPTPQTRFRGPFAFWLRGLFECRSRGSLEFSQPGLLRSELLRRQRRAALVGEAYIVGGLSECQQRSRSFLNFLRHARTSPFRPCVSRLGLSWVCVLCASSGRSRRDFPIAAAIRFHSGHPARGKPRAPLVG